MLHDARSVRRSQRDLCSITADLHTLIREAPARATNLIANALQYRERVSVVGRLHVKREDDVLPPLADVSLYPHSPRTR